MNHHPRREPSKLHDLGLGLAGAALVILLALAGQALAPDTAHGHVVRPLDCARYAATHATVTGTPAAPARRVCVAGALEHAHGHCNRIPRIGQRTLCTIRLVFGAYGAEAVSVAICESTANDPTPYPDHGIYARNGQYLGLFQMGEDERETYGHGTNARAQAEAAFRYFDASGRDWSPWECQP